MTENEVKACENWFSPLFYLFFVLRILFGTSKDFTLPAEPFFCLLDFGVLEKTLSLKKKDLKGSVRHRNFCIGEKERGALQQYCLLPLL